MDPKALEFSEHLQSLSQDELDCYRVPSIWDEDFPFPNMPARKAFRTIEARLRMESNRRQAYAYKQKIESKRKRMARHACYRSVIEQYKSGIKIRKIAENHKKSCVFVYKILEKFSIRIPNYGRNAPPKRQ